MAIILYDFININKDIISSTINVKKHKFYSIWNIFFKLLNTIPFKSTLYHVFCSLPPKPRQQLNFHDPVISFNNGNINEINNTNNNNIDENEIKKSFKFQII